MKNLLFINLKIAKEHAYNSLFYNEVVDNNISTSLSSSSRLNLFQKDLNYVAILIIFLT